MSCSTDKMLTVSNQQGDTPFDSFIVKGEPSNVKWCPEQDDESAKFMCCIIANQKIFHFNPKTQQHKFIEFDKSYGKLACFEWFDKDTLFIAFQTGQCLLISVQEQNLGAELHAFRPVTSNIEQIAINHEMRKVAVAAQGTIKFYNFDTWTEESSDRIDISKSSGQITQLHWTKDGSIMTLTTSGGYFLGFLTVIPQLFSAHQQYAALLSSLTEVSVVDCSRNNMIIGKTELEIEPAHINIGPDHFAVGMNDGVWYYRWRPIGANGDIIQGSHF